MWDPKRVLQLATLSSDETLSNDISVDTFQDNMVLLKTKYRPVSRNTIRTRIWLLRITKWDNFVSEKSLTSLTQFLKGKCDPFFHLSFTSHPIVCEYHSFLLALFLDRITRSGDVKLYNECWKCYLKLTEVNV